jgi:hypothetical protein
VIQILANCDLHGHFRRVSPPGDQPSWSRSGDHCGVATATILLPPTLDEHEASLYNGDLLRFLRLSRHLLQGAVTGRAATLVAGQLQKLLYFRETALLGGAVTSLLRAFHGRAAGLARAPFRRVAEDRVFALSQ